MKSNRKGLHPKATFISFITIGVSTALWEFLCYALNVAQDKTCLGVWNDKSLLTDDVYLDARNLYAAELPYSTDIKLKSHFIQREKESVKNTEWNKNTKPASVTVSSVQPGCFLMETEHCTHCSEERKLYVMVYKAGTSYIFRDRILVAWIIVQWV